MVRPPRHVECTAVLKHETDKAWLFEMETGDVWVPKSIGDYHEDDELVVLPEWWAMDKGLI
jgi:hypothetical protein